MTSKWNADSLVSARSKNIDRYKRNFLKQAVCELRFPTLMELGESKPPAALVGALRKEYPHLELANEVTIGIGAPGTNANNAHLFRSAKLTWTVSVRQSAIAIETKAYPGYVQMRERVMRVIDAASSIIDSDFFTRVGLRYINLLDVKEDPRNGWINPELIGPINSQAFNNIQEYAGKLMLMSDDGGCLLQHGIQHQQAHRIEDEAIPNYLIDIDAFRSEVSIDDAGAAIDALHAQAFDIFDWAIADKAREYLSKEKG